MKLVQRMRFPGSVDVLPLYFRFEGAADLMLRGTEQAVKLGQGATLSTGTYFNSFYEKYWADLTDLRRLRYQLCVRGRFIVKIVRERPDQTRAILSETVVVQTGEPEWVVLDLPEISTASDATGRVYLNITSVDEGGVFMGGRLVTEQKPRRDVALGIICVTFKREAFIHALIERWAVDEELLKKKCTLFVIDNGRSLDPSKYSDDRLRIVPNRNLGGSGGFNRGLLEASEEGGFTHYLLMDDDIVMDPDSILRLITFYEYSNVERAVSGALLDIEDQTMIFETGSCLGGILGGLSHPVFAIKTFHTGQRADRSETLNSLLEDDELDCSGFWFFGFPSDWLKESGLLMPFFIHGDDLEFCIRLKRVFGKQLLSLPSLAVWHHTWRQMKYRHPPHLKYYDVRNVLILYFLHGKMSLVRLIRALTGIFIRNLFVYDYHQSALILRAVRDAMKGPEFLTRSDTEELHRTVINGYSGINDSRETLFRLSYKARAVLFRRPPSSRPRRFAELLTLNGHLLPDFLLKDAPAPFFEGVWRSVFGFKRAILIKDLPNLYEHRMRHKFGVMLFVKWVGVCVGMLLRGPSRRREWRNARSAITNRDFVRKQMGVERAPDGDLQKSAQAAV